MGKIVIFAGGERGGMSLSPMALVYADWLREKDKRDIVDAKIWEIKSKEGLGGK